jgi:predicted O-methyltransferase YrrM
MLKWTGDDAFTVGDIAFRTQDLWGPLAYPPRQDEFVVFKPNHLAQRYADLIEEIRPENVFELGIFNGGSTVLLSTLTEAKKLVAVDISPQATPAFARWAELHAERVTVGFGVDQADQPTLRKLVADEFGDELLDLVVDDASHLLGPSRASFDVLFPRLRPGGLYVIEDWTIRHEMEKALLNPEERAFWDSVPAAKSEHLNALITEPPLSLLLFEASLSVAFSGVIDDVTIRREWAVVRRGEDPVDPDTFRIDDYVTPEARGFLNGL